MRAFAPYWCHDIRTPEGAPVACSVWSSFSPRLGDEDKGMPSSVIGPAAGHRAILPSFLLDTFTRSTRLWLRLGAVVDDWPRSPLAAAAWTSRRYYFILLGHSTRK